MKKKYAAVVIASLFCAGAMSVGAAQVPVFEYSFPASYNGTGAIITDQSSAGNNATLGTSGAPLTDDRPAGFAATQMSLGSSNGGARVDGNSPMTTTTVAANDGFVFDVWFKTADTVDSKLMSNGGYENLYTQNGNLIFSVDNSTAATFTGLTIGQWYHAVAVFDTTGNSLANGNIAGVARLYIDGTLIGSANKTMKNRGPDGSRGLAINMHPVNGAEANTGIVFNPSVSLGIPAVAPAPPVWIVPVNGINGFVGEAYSDTLVGKASDPNGDSITFSLIDTGTWLDVATDGALTNNRALVVGDLGTNSFQVVADDGITGSSTGTLSIVVITKPSTDPVVLFEYSFPASYDGTGTAVTDLSSAGNNATHNTSGAPLIADRPSEFDVSLKSLGQSQGGAVVDDLLLLNMADVEAHGGFSYDLWFKTTDTTFSKLIDYGGYDALFTVNDQIRFTIGNQIAVTYTGVAVGQWYHVRAIFETTSDNTGVATLYIDGVLVDSKTMTRSPAADTNRGLGINMHPVSSGEVNTGIIFNPSVYLGVYTGIGDPVAVEDLSISGPVTSGMLLVWTGEKEWTYIVQTNSNLIVGNWQPFITVSGKDGVNTVTNSVGPDQTFYRVISE